MALGLGIAGEVMEWWRARRGVMKCIRCRVIVIPTTDNSNKFIACEKSLSIGKSIFRTLLDT